MPRSRRVVLAFDSFKGSLTAPQACRAAAEGVARAGCDPIECPLSDGGEGFVESVCLAAGGSIERFEVTGPLFGPVSADVGFLDSVGAAIVEAAQVCGLGLVPEALRSPLRTTSRGLGELLSLLAPRVERVIVGLGGTATNDGGMGMLSALGWRFLDSQGGELLPMGGSLIEIQRIEPGIRLRGLRIVAACDVDNPLFGPRGAAYVYAPQKGASGAEVELLDQGLRRLADLISPAEALEPAAGAAGGLGYALKACLGARIASGAEFAIGAADLRSRLRDAALCITGEGRTDSQTVSGKLPLRVARECVKAQVPCVCLSGSLGPGWEGLLSRGCSAVEALAREDEELAVSIERTRERIIDAAARLTRVYMS